MRADDRQLNLPKREEKILEFWERNKIFEKTLEKTKRGKPFVFYEGPPYANGLPGIHHFLARVFKDIIIRYRTMRGFFVPRKAGWDTHGLPIEIVVEKKLGIASKKEIEEKIGIPRFIAEARKNVFFYKEEWERFTKRIGYWLDLKGAYLTMSADYMETLWWIIKEIWQKKLLYQDFKVVPWCPRCQTPLSSHELGFGYQPVRDRSVYVRFRVKAKDKRWANTAILSWTTTPWTLPGNVALAVNPDVEYVVIPDPGEKGQWLILGKDAWRNLIEKHWFPPEYRSQLMLDDIETVKGKALVGLAYEFPFSVRELLTPKSHRVYPADFVTMAEGTGVVHTAVMYGEDDYRLGTKVGLPKFHTVTETGHFIKKLGEGLGGRYVKDPKTEEKIIASLKRRGLLFAEERYEHEYPFCWRCETPLLYYAREGWWVKMSALRQKLIASNETIHWVPEAIKHGRFGEFLNEVRDWAFSRERYWGTPLPVWQCGQCSAVRAVGSLRELDDLDPVPTTLILMRHGQALHNVEGIMNPLPEHDRGNVLTEQGQQDVFASAKRLKKEQIDIITASPSFRAQETAKMVARTLGIGHIETIQALNDIYVGGFEGQPIAKFREFFASTRERFKKKPLGAENLREVRARMMAAVATIRKKYAGKRVLVVTHGDPSWVLMAAIGGLPEADYGTARYLRPAEFCTIRLHNWPYSEAGELDLHRPYIDSVRLKCHRCTGGMQRVPEVVDVWFDSGAMPFAQHHYPFEHTNDLLYPADYICEGVDMTRGWFYTLLAVATTLGRVAPYRNVISLGLVLDKNGQKMSKSKGNVVEPKAMIEKYGTDAIRWYFYTVNAPGDPKRFDERDVLLKLRGALSTLWNSFVFFDTYVDKVKSQKSKVKSSHVLDRWVLVKLDGLRREVTERLDGYDIVGAARLLDAFIVDDFSNWYLRRSRRRFQRPESRSDFDQAAAVLGFSLLHLCELMAPFTPFLAEIIYQELKKKLGFAEESVHLRKWPSQELKVKSQKLKVLMGEMAEVRHLASLALAERAKAGVRVRQPLVKLKVKSSKLKVPGLLAVLGDEVNVKEVVLDPRISGEVALDTQLTGELREEGLIRELVRNIQEMRRSMGLRPPHRVRLQVVGDEHLGALIERWKQFIQRDAGVKAIQLGGKKNFTVEREVKLAGMEVWVGIKKA